MAKLVTIAGGRKLWALTEAEDYVVIDAYDKIKRFVPPTDTHWSELENHYFENGKMLADLDLVMLNTYSKRKGFPPVVLRHSHSDSHSILGGSEKGQLRKDILDKIQSLTPEQREMVLDQRRNAIMRQPDRNVVQDAMKEKRTYPLEVASNGMKRTKTQLSDQLASAIETGAIIPKPAPVNVPQAEPVTVQPRILPSLLPEPRIEPEPDAHHHANSIWVHRNGERKRLPAEEVAAYLAQGWTRGRGPYTGVALRNAPTETSPVATAPFEEQPKFEEVPIVEATVEPEIEIEIPAAEPEEVEPEEAEQDEIDFDDIEAILAKRQSRVEASGPGVEAYESLKEEVATLRAEVSRLKRIVYQFAASA